MDPTATNAMWAGSLGTSKGYTGQYNDSLTGLDYYNARYYDPVVGRFLSADTVQGNGQGMDPYAYVGGNPETETDPTGHQIPTAEMGGEVQIANDNGSNGGGSGNWLTPVIGVIGTGIATVVGWFTVPPVIDLAPGTIDWGGASPPMTAINSLTRYRTNHSTSTGGGGGNGGGGGGGGNGGGGWTPPPTTSWTSPWTVPHTQTGGGGGRGGIKSPKNSLAPPPPPERRRMNPDDVRYTQHQCDNQGQGYTVEQNIQSLKDGSLSPDDLDPIRVFRKTGDMDKWGSRTKYGYTGDPANLANDEWYSLDNRRLYAFKLAGITDIPVDIVSSDTELLFKQRYKFSTTDEGVSIEVCY